MFVLLEWTPEGCMMLGKSIFHWFILDLVAGYHSSFIMLFSPDNTLALVLLAFFPDHHLS
uniref:Uncharacterized protein n=1 Tax=Trichinella nativa TaxID=6335 RepID=A0A0V1KHD6_9BILA